jgi:hypothetical protein
VRGEIASEEPRRDDGAATFSKEKAQRQIAISLHIRSSSVHDIQTRRPPLLQMLAPDEERAFGQDVAWSLQRVSRRNCR